MVPEGGVADLTRGVFHSAGAVLSRGRPEIRGHAPEEPPRSPKDAQRSPKDSPKDPPRSPKGPQGSPKDPPRTPKDPKDPQEPASGKGLGRWET